jgi:hypothetical protein
MPNWSYNLLKLTGPNESLDKFYNENKNFTSDNEEHLDFYKSVPIPENQTDNWYDWNCNNLGTKWNVRRSIFDKEKKFYYNDIINTNLVLKNKLNINTSPFRNIIKEFFTYHVFTYRFDTAWSPPCSWLEKITKKYTDILFSLEFEMEGYDDSGIFEYKNGKLIHNEFWSTSQRYYEENKEKINNIIKEVILNNPDFKYKNTDADDTEIYVKINDKLNDEDLMFVSYEIIESVIDEILKNKN